jgi:hypothetical protein
LDVKYSTPSGGFGPVADDGYGVSYYFCGDGFMFFHVSSKISSQFTDSVRFAEQIFHALRDILAVLSNGPDPSASKQAPPTPTY